MLYNNTTLITHCLDNHIAEKKVKKEIECVQEKCEVDLMMNLICQSYV